MNTDKYPSKNSKNYNLTKDEENNTIDYINQLLKDFENHLDIISFDTTIYSIMPLGRKICNSMLELLLGNGSYSDLGYFTFMDIINISIQKNIIPQKYGENLHFIRRYSNIALHGGELKYENLLTFLKKFCEVINWFNITLSKNNEGIFYVDEITLKIDSILKAPNKPIKKYPKPPKHSFYKKEESEEIKYINKLLNDYAEQLKSISSEKKFYYVTIGAKMSELMTKLLLKKEGYYDAYDYPFFENIRTLNENNIIPNECAHFLHLIRKYRNDYIHRTVQSDKPVLSFLNAFNYFIQWFDNYYTINYQKSFQIEECCNIINSLTYDKKTKTLTFVKNDQQIDKTLKIQEFNTNQDIIKLKKEIKKLTKTSHETIIEEYNEKVIEDFIKDNASYEQIIKEYNEKVIDDLKKEYIKKVYDTERKSQQKDLRDDEIKRLKEKLKIKEEEHQQQIEELNHRTEGILEELHDTVKLFGQCMAVLDEIKEQGERVESKIDNINSKIDIISNQIKTIQSFTERQISIAQSTEEIERIIETYINECIDNIMQHSVNFTQNQNYQIEQQKLIYSIGEDGWNKLCEKSKTFLITSKVMYNHLITMDDIIDYSGICVLVTKALEVEIHKRFFTNFLRYLNEKYGRDYKKYPTSLLYQKRKPLLSEKFTMGSIAYVLCYREKRNDSYEQKINNKSRLIEYCRQCVFSNMTEEEIEERLTFYASSIEDIREKYRNPSAHTNEIKRVDAEECFNLVLDIEKLLKKMLDSFDR